MKLRWFVTLNKHGFRSESLLQYWDKAVGPEGRWQDVPYVECKDWEEEKYLTDEEAV